MNYESWEKDMPEEIMLDSLWKSEAYKLSLFAFDIGWHDITKLSQDKRTISISDQLCRSLGSVSANISEGYPRGTGKDRARFYEYALGSARESRVWYYKSRHILGKTVLEHRIKILTQIIKMLLTMIPDQRKGGIRENSPDGYFSDYLVEDIPLP